MPGVGDASVWNKAAMSLDKWAEQLKEQLETDSKVKEGEHTFNSTISRTRPAVPDFYPQPKDKDGLIPYFEEPGEVGEYSRIVAATGQRDGGSYNLMRRAVRYADFCTRNKKLHVRTTMVSTHYRLRSGIELRVAPAKMSSVIGMG